MSTNYETIGAKVCNLEDFHREVRAIWEDSGLWAATLHPWYRGQSSESWGLLPGLYRGKHNPAREREMLRDFKTKALTFLPQIPPSDLECMFIMQHHGVPTRLLDWTESYDCALFFAIAHSDGDGDAAVWVLDPWALNETALGYTGVPTAYAEELNPYLQIDNIGATVPTALRPSYNSKRLAAQRGMFTLHGNKLVGLEDLIVWETGRKAPLYKLVIQGSKKAIIQKQLYGAGVSFSNLFPDLDGLCSDLTMRYSDAYLEIATNSEALKHPHLVAALGGIPQQDNELAGSISPPLKVISGNMAAKKDTGRVQPKKESVRVVLPPKPTAAASKKLPTLPPGGPGGNQKPNLLIVPPQKMMDEESGPTVPPPSPLKQAGSGSPDGPYDDYLLKAPADYFVFQNWKKYKNTNSHPSDERRSNS